MSRQRPTDTALLTLALGFLIPLLLVTVLAFFVDPWWRWVAFVWFLGYAAIVLRAGTADQPADPNPPLPWDSLEVAFHRWGDRKGVGIAAVALMLGLIPVLLMLLFL
jgi:hypothetical protein